MTIGKTVVRASSVVLNVLCASAVFLGIFALLIVALVLVSGGVISLPVGALRVLGIEEIFVSDIPPLTMLFSGGFMLLSGIALILLTAGRICPAAAAYVYRIFSGNNKK